VTTVVVGDFEWDDVKAEINLVEHDVPFEEAITAFDDPRHVIVDDGSGTETFLLIGFSIQAHLLTVVHIERRARERIISAWRATRREADLYQRGR
jgi:uncharacterized DUF497 family protein